MSIDRKKLILEATTKCLGIGLKRVSPYLYGSIRFWGKRMVVQ